MYIICSLCKRYTKDILFWNHYSIDIPGVYATVLSLQDTVLTVSPCPNILDDTSNVPLDKLKCRYAHPQLYYCIYFTCHLRPTYFKLHWFNS